MRVQLWALTEECNGGRAEARDYVHVQVVFNCLVRLVRGETHMVCLWLFRLVQLSVVSSGAADARLRPGGGSAFFPFCELLFKK